MSISNEVRPGDVQSLHRALQLMEAVGAAGDLGVSELAAELELAVSTVHNMLRTLVHRGYLTNTKGRYRLGPAVTALAMRWDPLMSLADTVPSVLAEVSRASGYATYASVLTGPDLQIVGYQPAPGLFTSNITVGLRDNPMIYATGRVLVAWTQRPSDWGPFVERAVDVTPRRSRDRWTKELGYIAEHGVCVKVDEEGNSTIAVPVWMKPTVVLAAICASIPAHQTTAETVERALDIVWEHAESLSADLGCPTVPITRPTQPRWM